MPSSPVALLALALWLPLTFVLFARLTPQRALLVSVLGGYLFLPPLVAFDLPLMPMLDKLAIPAIGSYLAAWMIRGERAPLFGAGLWAGLCVAMILGGAVGTALTNPDPRFVGGGLVLPGLTLRDGVSMLINIMPPLLIWALGVRYVRSPRDLREVLGVLVAAMLIYSVPMLIEVRLSPQLNVWVYGFFQHSFEQMMRSGGFRPIVFLEHGIWVALMTYMAAHAAAMLTRLSPPESRGRMLGVLLYLLVMVVLCRTLAAWLYMGVFIPLILMAPSRLIGRMAALMAVAVVCYPLLRLYGLVPIDWMLEMAGKVSAERAFSLEYRFDNEWVLLQHVQIRPFFGWGEWNRNHVFDLDGTILTVTDGEWIVVMSARGIVGFVGRFGLLAVAVLRAVQVARRLTKQGGAGQAPLLLTGAALLLAVNMVDLIPNATMTPLTWLLAGALTGAARFSGAPAEDERLEDDAPPDHDSGPDSRPRRTLI